MARDLDGNLIELTQMGGMAGADFNGKGLQEAVANAGVWGILGYIAFITQLSCSLLLRSDPSME